MVSGSGKVVIEGKELSLFTDLYELTMLRAYHALGMEDVAVFSLFVRTLPPRRNYLLACGLETVLDFLAGLPAERGEPLLHCHAS